MTLGEKIAVMQDGVIHQYDSPQQTYDHPVDRFVAGFIGSPAVKNPAASCGALKGKRLNLYI